MPRFFFDTQVDAHFITSDVALDYVDLVEAHGGALHALIEMAKSFVVGQGQCDLAIIIRDEQGTPLLRSMLTYEAVLVD